MERMEAIISGRVQGVMYRDFAMRKAHGLSLVGCVRNLPDGRVQVVAEGRKEKLEAFNKKLHQGPLFAQVTDVRTSFTSATGAFSSFRIEYS